MDSGVLICNQIGYKMLHWAEKGCSLILIDF